MIIVDWDLIKENNSSKTIFFLGENKFDSVNNGLKCGYFLQKLAPRKNWAFCTTCTKNDV